MHKLESIAEQLIPSPTNAKGYVSQPVGTAFDPDPVMITAIGNMGDVIKVDLKDLAARKLLKLDLLKKESEFTAQEQADLLKYKTKLGSFSLDPGVLERLGLTTARSGSAAADTPTLLIAAETVSGKSKLLDRRDDTRKAI